MAEQPPLPPPAPAMVQAAPARTDGMAIASLILGILAIPGGVFYGVFGILFGALAIVFGLDARRRIRRAGGTIGGSGLALVAWILGICGVVIGLAEIVVLIGIVVTFRNL